MRTPQWFVTIAVGRSSLLTGKNDMIVFFDEWFISKLRLRGRADHYIQQLLDAQPNKGRYVIVVDDKVVADGEFITMVG